MTSIKGYLAQNGITEYEIFQDEGISGAKQSRPALDKLMVQVREKEIKTVIVYSFSRFARSTRHLLTALDEFNSLGVAFVSITERLDSHSAHGRLVFSILSAIAELERHIIRDRVKAGLTNAKLKGVKLGSPKKRNSILIQELRREGLSYRRIAQLAAVSIGTVHAEMKACSVINTPETK